jgi:RNA polymerase sigma factor (sigma-70 family)
MLMRADTQTMTLPASAEDAFAFLAQPENLPRWAVGFARGIRREGDEWIVRTAEGSCRFASTPMRRGVRLTFTCGWRRGSKPSPTHVSFPTTGAPSTSSRSSNFPAWTTLSSRGSERPWPRSSRSCRSSSEPRWHVQLVAEIEGTLKAMTPIETLVARAQEGDRAALEAVIASVRDRIYNLALRMLWHPADAEDATQEILVRLVTHLGSFRGESAFTTWVFRVASNYLLTTRKRRAEREELTFEHFAEQLDAGLAPEAPGPATEVENRLLVEEVKLGCSHGMLLCLDREHRLAYILGDVFDLTSQEAAEIVGNSPVAFRKRLSRARSRLHGFMERKCGLVNPVNPCRCARRVDHAVQIGRVDPERLLFATHPVRLAADTSIREVVREMDQLHSAADLLRGHPDYAAPGKATEVIRSLLRGSRLRVLAS